MILESDGYFWWDTTPVPKGHFAPSDAVSGRLSIYDDGLANLDLNGLLTSASESLINLLHPSQKFEKDRFILGILKTGSRRVILGGLRSNGTTHSNVGVSHQKFESRECVVTDGSTTQNLSPNRFRSLSAPLEGFEDWVGTGSIEIKKRRGGLSATYRRPPDSVYAVDGASLVVEHVALAPVPWSDPTIVREIVIRQRSFLTLRMKTNKTIGELYESFRLLEDFMLLLTGVDMPLQWPMVKTSSGVRATYYFKRDVMAARNISWMECWTSFTRIQPALGTLFATFQHMQNELGPGLYLYVGVRRESRLYLENRFVTLIWGLESLHRGKQSPNSPPNALEQKISRILEKITNKSDHRWLEYRLRNASEPSLQERLLDLFSRLPLDLEESSLKRFCHRCSEIRNDISHFGGQRHRGDYQLFGTELSHLSLALAHLYHTLLLSEMGIQEEVLREWTYRGPQAHRYRQLFQYVGLNRNV